MKRVFLYLVVFNLFVIVPVAHAYHYYESPAEGWSAEQNSGQVSHAIGAVFSSLPDGARSVTVQGVQYFVTDNNWFRPVLADGIKYIVVFAPV